MARGKRKYTPEFKAEAVRIARDSRDSYSKVALNLGIQPSVLGQWIKAAEIAEGTRSPPRPDSLPDDRDQAIAELKKRLAQTELERDFLKKAAAFFAKESK
jgi:transposase